MKNLARIVKLLVSVGLMASFMGCAATHKQSTTDKQSTTGIYIDDAIITTKVKSAIFEEPELKVFQINVKTVKGEVHLSGDVKSEACANKAADIAAHVDGVKSVSTNLVVK